MQYFSPQSDGQWHENTSIKDVLGPFAEEGSKLDLDPSAGPGPASADDKALRNILYHVESLRKRPGAED